MIDNEGLTVHRRGQHLGSAWVDGAAIWLVIAYASLSVPQALLAQAKHPDGQELLGDPPTLRKQLHDPRPSVRLQAARALARQQDIEAISVLIELLAELNPEERRQAEEVLRELAGDWAPELILQRDDDISRRMRCDLWRAWWRNTDGEFLLLEFRKRTLSATDQARVEALIEQLGDGVYAVRERASDYSGAHAVWRDPYVAPRLERLK